MCELVEQNETRNENSRTVWNKLAFISDILKNKVYKLTCKPKFMIEEIFLSVCLFYLFIVLYQ